MPPRWPATLFKPRRHGAALRAWLCCWLWLCTAPAWAAGTDCLPAEVPGYARQRADTRESVVVFLHGLHGDARATWSTSNWVAADTAWPCLMLDDAEQFPATRAYLASYRSVMAGENPSTQQVARELAGELVKDGVFGHSHVTFVAHSMGGIILARMLTDQALLTNAQRQRIRLVVFVGTPAQPTDAAAICSKFGINAQCQEMSDGTAMAGLWTAWDQLHNRPRTWCVAEGKDMPWLGVPPWLRIVPEASAHRPCKMSGQTRAALGLDHSQIAKPATPADRPHRDLQVAYSACVKSRIRPPLLAQEEQPLAARVRPWFDQWVARLEPPGTDWRQAIAASTAPGEAAFFFPQGGTATFDLSRYDRLASRTLASEMERVIRPVLLQKNFDWVRPTERVAPRIADGAMDALLDALRSSGQLQQGDLLVALPVWSQQPDVLWLLAIRPANAGYGLLGILAVPTPATICVG